MNPKRHRNTSNSGNELYRCRCMISFAIDSIRAGYSCVGVGPVDEGGRTMRSECQQEMTGAVMSDDQLRSS